MNQKKVVILYRSPQNLSNNKAIQFIKGNLEEVFGEYVLFENCFMADLQSEKNLRADAFLAIDERVFEKAREYIRDFSRVIKIERSLTRSMLKEISDLPAGTDILVVNDSYTTALDTVYLFYETGISHVNLIPFDRKKESTGIYNHLTTAITPAERHFVPEHIKNVIDIGYRYVSFDTMLKLMKMLDLDNGVVNRNLFKYMQPLAESNSIFHADYIYSYLKNEMLRQMADTDKTGILLADNSCRLIYANREAVRIFHGADIRLKEMFGTEDWQKCSFRDEPVCINDVNYDCIRHPIKLMEETAGFYITLHETTELMPAKKENRQKGYVARHCFHDIIHISEEMKKAVHAAEQIAMSEHTVIIYGESGTGKELFAQSIHNGSFRKSGPFIAVNCASLSENLLESELFGYEPGAFTGANSRGKSGLFEQADNGSIFLDEIGEISPKLQTKLLRVIQEKQVMRIGSDHIIDVNVRLIAATNKDLEAAVREGAFRSDLFYRLNVLPIYIPPVRNRTEDIVPLLQHFLGNRFKNLTTEEVRRLTSYSWQGNVREMENFCTYYETLASFPEYLSKTEKCTKNQLSTADIRQMILGLIRENTELSHGIGREALLKELKAARVNFSDRSLRAVLKVLQSEGLIESGKGRQGMRVTEKGIRALSEMS